MRVSVYGLRDDHAAGPVASYCSDWRNAVLGADPREGGDGDADAADVLQCRVRPDGSIGSDTCPFAGGLDQNIYGSVSP